MTWSIETLRQLAADRGETSAGADVGRVLLAHERMRGRTEEDYPPDVAARELDGLLETFAGPLPQPTHGYGGLRQLGRYAADRAAAKTVSEDKTKADPVAAPHSLTASLRAVVRGREAERERG